MAWESELRTFIEEVAQTEAVWGAPLDNSKYPLVTMNLISDPVFYLLNGDVELRKATVQIDAWGLSYEDALTVRKRIEAAILADREFTDIEDVGIVIIRGGSERDDEDLIYRQTIDARIVYQ